MPRIFTALVGWLVGWLVGICFAHAVHFHYAGWLVGWFVGWLVVYAVVCIYPSSKTSTNSSPGCLDV